jgi:hypothetical protein
MYSKHEFAFIGKENYCRSGKYSVGAWLNDDAVKTLSAHYILCL